MKTIPYNAQIDSTRHIRFLTPEFCQKTLRGLCNTKFRHLYRVWYPDDENSDFVTKLHRFGLFTDRDPNELRESLTYGELCDKIYSVILSGKQPPKHQAMRKLAAAPFTETSAMDNEASPDPISLNEIKNQPRSGRCPNVFDPAVINRKYRLCGNGFDARWLYWTRLMTKEEFFDAAIHLTDSDSIENIKECHLLFDRDLEERMMYIGAIMNRLSDPSEFDAYDFDPLSDYINLRIDAELLFDQTADHFILIPLSLIYQRYCTEKEISLL